ncbi:helix-turn-helix domain-containing protein [Geodermatophilus poikilotrophus]|uniref:Helix-turn-helix domain-containing protein n=1 Tax=Geodermatophilus poikilotrophus TaxID=1333667 RepID=A0A1I0DMI3_9ACTN|nr:helix-turn-helix domain-containing protein [Geodermatophilus poikilotrophus]SET33326.1 Helix-turn-helix domain-containing protein [Geodermatophilus poikilotrophus]
MRKLFAQLRQLREDAGLSYAEAEELLVVGPGWVRRLEAGEIEPSLNTLAAVVSAYGSDLPTLFEGFELGDDNITIDRHLSAVEVGSNLHLTFPMGAHRAEVVFEDASVEDLNDVVRALRDELAVGRKREAVVACFLEAVRRWPHINPSDIWYFLVSHAYQDNFNHPASQDGRDWGQSWRRAGGWGLEAVLLQHYNPYLRTIGMHLEMPEPDRKRDLLSQMGVVDVAGSDKADVIAVGHLRNRHEAFGVIHVKASFAERRTDDVPLSQQLIARGYASPLVTMDCKATPSPNPLNRGELGPAQGGDERVSAKRLDIERDRKFDACFSYNTNTISTPEGQRASARIHVCDFSDPDDVFSAYLLRKWRDRQGLT